MVGKTTKTPSFNSAFHSCLAKNLLTPPIIFVQDSQNEGVYACMSPELCFVKENAIGAQADFHALLQIYIGDASDETQIYCVDL